MTYNESEQAQLNRNSVPIQLSGIGTRIGELTDLLGGKQSVAKIVHKSEMQVGRYIKEESVPGIDVISALAQAARVRIDWLATGEGAKGVDDGHAAAEPQPSDAYAHLPLYDVRAAAGHGAVIETEEVVDSLAFKKEWIHNELHANPADLYLLYVHGDSMEPALRAGEVILVNRRASAVQHDGIYVLVMDGTLLVKRLQSLPGGRIRISSDNPAYQPFEMEKTWLHPERQNDAEGAGIIGRVVWAGRRM